LGRRREHTPLPERTSYKCYYTTGKKVKIPGNLGFLPGPRRIQQPGHCWSELTFQPATGRSIRALPSAFSLYHIKPTRPCGALLSNNRPLNWSNFLFSGVNSQPPTQKPETSCSLLKISRNDLNDVISWTSL
jgi:hypothetical protein